jgi:hypothetical protein
VVVLLARSARICEKTRASLVLIGYSLSPTELGRGRA